MPASFDLLTIVQHLPGLASSGVEIAAKSFLWMSAALIAAALLRAAPAAARHAVWVTALASLLLLPVLAYLLPGWQVLPEWASPGRFVMTDHNASTPVATSGGILESGLSSENIDRHSGKGFGGGRELAATERSQKKARIAAQPGTPLISLSGALAGSVLLVWLAGAVAIAVRAVVSQLRLAQLARSARVVLSGHACELLNCLREQFGVIHDVALRWGPRKAMPMAWGIWRSFILLPEDAAGWNERRLRAVLLHELAHLKRRDPAVQLLVQVTLALYWFNPLVWLTVGRLKADRERACDEAVISHGVLPCDYAAHLLAVVAGRRASRWWGATALCIARTSRIENRLAWILSFRGSPRAWKRRGLIVIAAAAFSATVPLAMLRAGSQPPADDTAKQGSSTALTPVENAQTPAESDAEVMRAARLVDLSEDEALGLRAFSDGGQLRNFDWSLVLDVGSVDTLPALAAAAGLDAAQKDEVERWVSGKRFGKPEQLLDHATDPQATESEIRLIEKLDQFWQRQRANLSVVEELLESDQLTATQNSALDKLKSFLNRQQLPSIYAVRQVFVPDGTGRSSWTAIFQSRGVPGKSHRMAILHAAVGGRIPIKFVGTDDTLFYIELTAGDDRSVSVRVTPGDPQFQPPGEITTYELIRDRPVEFAAAGHEFWLSYGSTWIARSSRKPTSSTANLFLTVKSEVNRTDNPALGDRPGDRPVGAPLTLQLTEKGTVLLGGDEIPIAGLRSSLLRENQAIERAEQSTITVIIHAHRDVPTAKVQELIKLCQKIGFEKFSLRAQAH